MAGEWALSFGQAQRARALVQIGNIFRIQAMARWWTKNGVAQMESSGDRKKFEPRIQVEYTTAITQLYAVLQVPLRPLTRFVELSGNKLRIDVHSICNYRSDPTSNTG